MSHYNITKMEKESRTKKKNRLMRKYRLTIHNENKLENVLGFNVSPFWAIISLFTSLLLVAGTVYLVIAFTPVGEYLPGYVSDRTRERFVNFALTIDSLKEEVDKQERYISNIKNILEGRVTENDTVMTSDTLPSTDEYPIETTQLEQEFAEEFEKQEKYNLTSQATSVGALHGINFYRPSRGMLIKHFNPKEGHYGVDIAETPNESVVAIWDGTVIMSDYTATDGYMLVVQHKEDLVSVYRNCYRLLKSVGDKVAAGEVIASLSSGDNETHDVNLKPYLHLELWHRGIPLDPNIYIAF